MAKTTVINNPVDVMRIRELADAPVAVDFAVERQVSAADIRLLAVGRLTWQKGFDLLIEAVALCKDLSISLTVLGDGPLRSELVRLAEQCGVSDRVSFLGFQGNPYPFFRQADVFVLSSRVEGLPNVVLESLACGVPVIATPAAGGAMPLLGATGGACVVAESVTSGSLAAAIRIWASGGRRAVDQRWLVGYGVSGVVAQYELVLLS